MGCGCTRSASTQTESIGKQPMNSKFRSSRSSIEPLPSSQQPISTRRKRHSKDESEWALPVQRKKHAHEDLDWPLPPDEDYPEFQLNDNSDSDQYAFTPLSPRRPMTSDSSTSRAQANVPHNERDTIDENWKKNPPDSQIIDSVQIQSQLSARFHACFNLTASDNIDVVMDRIKNSQKDLDDRLKRRLAKVSTEAEQKIALIVADLKQDQKLLLDYDKKRQKRQHQLYEEWLQKYVVQLDIWRSKELATLQKQLSVYQEQIILISKLKIDRLNDEANRLKAQILNEEQNAVIEKTTKLTDKLYDMTRDDAQYHGSESKTELNLRVQANVGTIAPGQSCTNDFVD